MRSANRGPRPVWWLPVIAVAAVGQYLLFPRFMDAPPHVQHRLAILAGGASLSAGCVWIGMFATSAVPLSRKKRVSLLVGPLGATQVCAGLTLLFFAAGLINLMFFAVAAAIVSMIVFTVLLFFPARDP